MMNFIHLNRNWNAEPNAPEVEIQVQNDDVKVLFFLNAFIYPQFAEEDKGILTFHKCIQYRYGSPNDEGFYSFGQSRYKQYGVKWGEFYLVEQSDWRHDFPDAIIVNKLNGDTHANHYLFYFRDGTFEVVAQDYEFEVIPIKQE